MSLCVVNEFSFSFGSLLIQSHPYHFIPIPKVSKNVKKKFFENENEIHTMMKCRWRCVEKLIKWSETLWKYVLLWSFSSEINWMFCLLNECRKSPDYIYFWPHCEHPTWICAGGMCDTVCVYLITMKSDTAIKWIGWLNDQYTLDERI